MTVVVRAALPRRVPLAPLPTTTFVYGRTPRPPEGWADDVDRADWFAFGCDLFDAGCFFEAHELWERCWLAARAVGNDDDARFVQGLIKLAAAGVKLLDDKPESLASHLRAGSALLAQAEPRRGISRAVLDAAISELTAGRPPRLSAS